MTELKSFIYNVKGSMIKECSLESSGMVSDTGFSFSDRSNQGLLRLVVLCL